jgi:predicted metal-dependent peptidase
MPLDPKIDRQVKAALLQLRLHTPYFAAIALFARIEASKQVPTAATDGRDVFLNEAFFAALLPAEQAGLLLHEILHAALLHVPRRGSRDPRLWNVAADIVINGMIAQVSSFALPAGGLRNSRLERFSVEEAYELLLQEAPDHPGPPWADLQEGGKGNATEQPLPRAALEGHWRNAHHQARMVLQARGHGDAPHGMARELAALEPAQLDWRSYLWRYLVRTPVDFVDFDRRFVGRGLYLETLAGESVRVHVAVDTSGSITPAQLRAFVGEIAGIVAAYPHLQCDLYYADAEVHGPYPLTVDTPLPRPLGGGGTSFTPFFDRVAAELEPLVSTVLVYLTDGEGSFPDQPPLQPVLWVVTPGGRDLATFPFGETARLLLEDGSSPRE